ncbi:MAG TPA: nucleoside hydrolase [Streptosporangiaceae bacterium]|nr:nucleoside hydrolase [Streptosporangiaceae bacterium]
MSTPPSAAGSPRKILLDCDPGIDDALAIVFACGHPGLELCGVTTVAGNVGLARTTANALSVLDFTGRPDVPVAAGSAVPLLRPHGDARHVHGESGLGGAQLPAPRARPVDVPATDLIIDIVGSSPGEIILAATGPLTNIALAVRRQPELIRQVADFVIMGGSAARGNVTPAAEYNIATDPEAAAIVFGAGWRVTMVGLDATLQARADRAVQERLAGLGRLGRELLLPALGGYRAGEAETAQPGPGDGRPGGGRAGGPDDPPGAGPAVHDVCALALAAEPALFGCVPGRIEVETAGRWTTGMTVTDFQAPEPSRNALVATTVDAARFWDTVIAAWARIPAAQPAG